MDRELIPNHGPDETNITKGFAATVKACRRLGVEEFTLLMASKRGFSTTVAAKMLGAAAVKSLLSGKTVAVLDGVRCRFDSVGTVNRFVGPAVVLAMHVSAKDLKIIDDLTGTKAVVCVPWCQEDGEAWQQRWNASVPGQSLTAREPQLHPTVLEELERLTQSVNLSTGLGHTMDKEKAERVFEELRKGGIPIAPVEVGIWAVRNGWSVEHAGELEGLAERFAR